MSYEDGKPVGVTQIVLSTSTSRKTCRRDRSANHRALCPQDAARGWITKDTVWHINPTGKFFIGGPDGDCG